VAAVVDPQGQRLITLSTDRQVIEWDMSPQGGVGRPLPALPDRWMTGRPAVVEPGRLVAVPTRPVDGTGGDPRRPPASTARVTATFLDPSTGHLVDQVEVGDAAQPPDVGYPFGASAAVSPDGTRVAVTAGTTTTVLDSRSRRQVARLVLAPPALPSAEAQLPAAVITSVAWTLDGASLLLGTQGGIDSDGHLQSGGLLIRIDTGSWTESGRTLVWHDSLALQGAPVAVVPSPDGRLLAVSSAQGGISIVDSGTLQTRHVVDVGSLDAIDDLQWSRDGRRIAAAGLSGRLYVIDTATWAPAGEPQAFGAPLLQVDWLRDERTLAVSALDGTVALVDADRGTIRSRLMAPVGSARADYTRLVPSPGGELTVLSGERPGRSHSLHAAAWLRQVCTVAGRDLTRAEWARYLPGRAFRPTCSDLR
jgi:WD40 repeat protein